MGQQEPGAPRQVNINDFRPPTADTQPEPSDEPSLLDQFRDDPDAEISTEPKGWDFSQFEEHDGDEKSAENQKEDEKPKE